MLKRLLPALLLCLPITLNAVVIDDLYQAEVPVADQSEASQKSGLADAMLAVLVKLTGDRHIKGRPVAAELLKQPEKYLQQYKFRNKPVMEGNQLTLREQLYLWASFNPPALDRVLREYSVPIWGSVRPTALVWLSMENDSGRRYVGLEDETGFTALLDAQARARGIGLAHPLLDSEDRQQLPINDIRSGFVDPIRSASTRYPADAVLAGHLRQTGEAAWQADWISLVAENESRWSANGSAAAVLEEGINRLADLLADRYLQSSTFAQETGIEVVVNDIENYEQHVQVLKYLRSLNSVTNAQVKTVEAGQVTYLLTASGGELAIQRAIELGKTLQSLTGTGSPYRLLR